VPLLRILQLLEARAYFRDILLGSLAYVWRFGRTSCHLQEYRWIPFELFEVLELGGALAKQRILLNENPRPVEDAETQDSLSNSYLAVCALYKVGRNILKHHPNLRYGAYTTFHNLLKCRWSFTGRRTISNSTEEESRASFLWTMQT
jgi:hypothetical protein